MPSLNEVKQIFQLFVLPFVTVVNVCGDSSLGDLTH